MSEDAIVHYLAPENGLVGIKHLREWGTHLVASGSDNKGERVLPSPH